MPTVLAPEVGGADVDDIVVGARWSFGAAGVVRGGNGWAGLVEAGSVTRSVVIVSWLDGGVLGGVVTVCGGGVGMPGVVVGSGVLSPPQ